MQSHTYVGHGQAAWQWWPSVFSHVLVLSLCCSPLPHGVWAWRRDLPWPRSTSSDNEHWGLALSRCSGDPCACQHANTPGLQQHVPGLGRRT